MSEQELIYQSWSCLFCDEAFKYEMPARRHALQCTYNPANRTCDTCANQIFTCTFDSDGDYVTKCKVKPTLDDVWQEDCELWEAKE